MWIHGKMQVSCEKDGYRNAISQTAIHVGFEINGNVYCNVYPAGLPTEDWINSFAAYFLYQQEITPIVTRFGFGMYPD